MAWRMIAHVDMDAFYASIEALDHPELRGQPLIVGGGVSRGVVSAASYEARQYGIHSAMPMTQALRRCPQVVVRPVNMARYRAVSRQVMALLAARTPLLEQVSVDEAYLDLTHWLPPGATIAAIARDLQEEVLSVTGLSCSIGVATGKAMAKMASDLRKPRGLVIIPPGQEAEFLAPLSIGKLRGVGEATERRLRALGVATIGDLARMPEAFLTRRFGMHGRDLLQLARGIDDSPVVPERQAKSIGRETTFLVDVQDRALLERTLLELAEDVAESLRRHQLLARGVTLKIRYGDFSTFTRAHAFPEAVDTTDALYQQAVSLLRAAQVTRPLRLIGITAGPLLSTADRQLSLFDAGTTAKQRKLDTAMDAVRAKFGADAIKRARLVDSHDHPGDDA